MVIALIGLVNILVSLIWLLVIVHVALSYFMSPYHPIREMVDRLVSPMLDPIRRIMPVTGGLDFSPVVLLILVQILGSLLKTLLLAL